MLGVFLNLILIALASLSAAYGISFFIKKNDFLYTRVFTLLFAAATFLTCSGFALLSFLPSSRPASIAHVIGLFGIDSFLLFELAFLFYDMKTSKSLATVQIVIFGIFELTDIFAHIWKNPFNYIRRELFTTFELQDFRMLVLHYSYIILLAATLLVLSIKWRRRKTTKRDKAFALRVILANLLIFAFDLLNILSGTPIFEQSPNFCYCAALSAVFFIWFWQVKKHSAFFPSVENVSKEVFYMIDVPILIFDLEGKLSLCNAAARWELKTEGKTETNMREILTLTDVKTLRLLAKAKQAISGKIETCVKSTGQKCAATYFVKLDYTGEPFCLIMKVIVQKQEEQK